MVLCNTLLAFAQNNQEIVYLKNGDKVKGIIIEEIPNTSIKVKTSNGSILVYSIHEIGKIISPEDEIFQKKNSVSNSTTTIRLMIKQVTKDS